MAKHTNPHSITRTLIPVIYSFLLLFFIWPASGASAGSATLTWDPPINTSEIDGYIVYYGQVSRHTAGFSDYEYSEFAGNTISYGIEGLEEGTIYYFAVTTEDIFGNESTYSDEVYCTISGSVVITVRDPFAPPEVIVDNGEAGTSSKGSWYVSGGANPYGNSSVYSKSAGKTYSFDAALHGTYEVSLWWTEWPSRSTSVPVEIYDGNTLIDTVLVNQTAQGDQWNVLGTYNFAGTARVTIVSEGTYSTCADAVKFLSADTF
jgi:hypothetical protein